MSLHDSKLPVSNELDLEKSGPNFVPPLYKQRYAKVRDIVVQNGINKVADFGCSEGKFLWYLKNQATIQDVAAVDIDTGVLHNAGKMASPLAWDYIFRRENPLRIRIYHGSIAEKDSRLKKYDAVTCIELIEHLPPETLRKLPETVFDFLRPSLAVFTTPNAEFNVLFPSLQGFRHWDHKFEWTREQFQLWGKEITERYPSYAVTYDGAGDPPAGSEHLGSCSQVATFKRTGGRIQQEEEQEECLAYTLVDEYQHPVKEKELDQG